MSLRGEATSEVHAKPPAFSKSDINHGPCFLSFQMLILDLLLSTVPGPQTLTSSKLLVKGTMGR